MTAVAKTDGSGRRSWLPVAARAVVVAIVFPAAVLKFVDHANEAAFFAEVGVPAPEVTVLLVGAVQFAAAIAIGVGAAGRIAALVVIPIMLTAIALAGVEVTNVAVLLGCLGIVAFGTGQYSLWEPEPEVVGVPNP